MILPWNIGGLYLYYCLLRMNLVPKLMSIWGLIATLFTLAVTFLFMFDLIKITTPAYFIMNVLTAFLEIILAFYLIFKGFKSNAVNQNN